jgi:hypothetical protein
VASKITVLAEVLGSDSNVPHLDLGIIANQDYFTYISDLDRYRAYPMATWTNIGRNGVIPKMAALSSYNSFRRVVGVEQTPNNVADWLATPARPWYWNVICGTNYQPNDDHTINIFLKVKITYYVKMLDMLYPQI